MNGRQLMAAARQAGAVLLVCAACTTAIVRGWPL